MRIWTLGAKVDDLDREIEFIERIGGRLLLDDRIPIAGRIHRVPLLALGDKYLHLAEEMVYEDRLAEALPRGLAHVVFEVTDLDLATRRAIDAGAVEILERAHVKAGFGARDVAFLRSPGGILFELIQIREHGVPRPGSDG